MLKFKRFEISVSAQGLLSQLHQDDMRASANGRTAKMVTSEPQKELECLCALGLINREVEIIPIGRVYAYSLTELGRSLHSRAA